MQIIGLYMRRDFMLKYPNRLFTIRKDTTDKSNEGIASLRYFWGKECTDGQIKLHSKYKLMLSDENRLSFWKYFKREAFPAQWGKVPFKYFQNQSMRKILFNICEKAAGTEQEEATMNFYRYFCSINRIPDNM